MISNFSYNVYFFTIDTSMSSGDLDLWDIVTQKYLYNQGRVLDIGAKNEVDPTNGLGGVCETSHTHTHTDRNEKCPQSNLHSIS